MDICSFVNSRDIREHLRKIGYSFNSLETAWLIYACKRLSYEEKKEYWRELIDTMPDCEVPSRQSGEVWNSLHAFLKRYIEVMDRQISEFYRDEPRGKYVYRYSFFYKGDASWCEDYESIFPSLSRCLEAYHNDAADLDENLAPGETGVVRYRIKRQALEDPGDVFEIECMSNGQTAEILHNASLSEEDSGTAFDVFECLWFDFPTPFQKGDIVWVPVEDNRIKWHCDGGFVLLGLSTWEPSDLIKSCGDNTDMNGYGYFVNSNGTFYHEVMYNYMDLEFYRGPYKLNEKILLALSKYLKGEIRVDLLLCAYRTVLLQVASDDIMLKCWYPEEDLKELGLV